MSTYIVPAWVTISVSVLLFTCIISYTLFYNYSSSSPYMKDIYDGFGSGGDDECENAMLNLLLYVLKTNESKMSSSSSSSTTLQPPQQEYGQYHYKNLRRHDKDDEPSSGGRNKQRHKRTRYKDDKDVNEMRRAKEDDGDTMDYIYTSTSHDYKLKKQRDMAQALTLL